MDVPELMPQVKMSQCFRICAGNCLGSCYGLQHQHVRCLRLVQPGQEAVHHPHPRSGVTTRSVQPEAARTTPSDPAADSTARTAVVPTATTRPPPALAALISRADASGTSNRSGYGGSCDSADATPVCSVIGANCTPC